MIPVHDYEIKYIEVFTIMKIQMFFLNMSHFLLLGAGGGGGGGSLFVVLYGMYSTLYMYGGGYLRLTLDSNCYLNPIAMTNVT